MDRSVDVRKFSRRLHRLASHLSCKWQHLTSIPYSNSKLPRFSSSTRSFVVRTCSFHPALTRSFTSLETRATLPHGSRESRKFCQEHQLSAQFFYSKCITRICLTLKMKVNVTEYNIHNHVIRLQISTSLKEIFCIFAQARTICKILTFQIFYLEKLGQGHGE